MDWLFSLLILAGVLVASTAFLVLFSSSSSSTSTSSIDSLSPTHLSETTFRSIADSSPSPLPSLLADPIGSIDLSIIVPAYNEELRLPGMLEDALVYLVKCGKSYEVLVVDDGSNDATSRTALDFAEQRRGKGGENVRVVTLRQNRGKGGAVKWGMLHARGRRLLFVDADGASEFTDLAALEKEMDEIVEGKKDAENGSSSPQHHLSNGDKLTTSKGALNGKGLSQSNDTRAIVLGSRAHMVKTEAVVKRSKLRNLLMFSFHTYLSLLGISNIRDTQCGFKLFTRSAASAIFPNLHVTGWIFDIEILIIAALLGDVQVKEVPIRWREVEGSKMNLVKDSIKMAIDLLVIRTSYALGSWKVRPVEYMKERKEEAEDI